MEKYYNNLIHEYLDGGLEAGEEETLFIALSGDDELRREFDKLLKISMVSSACYSFDTPPVETSAQIFSQLGFSLPAGTASSTAKKATGLAALTALLWKSIPFAAVAILAGALSIGAYKYFKTDGASQASAKGTPAAARLRDSRASGAIVDNSNINSMANQTGSFPELSSFEPQSGEASSVRKIRSGSGAGFYKTFATREEFEAFMRENSLAAAKFEGDSGNKPQSIEEGSSVAANFIEVSPYRSSFSSNGIGISTLRGGSHGMGITPQAPAFIPNYNLGLWESKKLSVEFRKLMTERRNQELLRNPNALNNYAAAVYYKFNDNFGVGIVLARENFPQSFTAPSGNKQTQNPTLTTYSIESRFSPEFLNIAGIALPYASAALGGSSMGPVGKFETGVSIAPMDLFELAFGWQKGYLIYNVYGTNYIADKSGFIWSVRVNF